MSSGAMVEGLAALGAAMDAVGDSASGPIPESAARSLLKEAEALLSEGPPTTDQRELWWAFLDLTGRPAYLRALPDDLHRRRWNDAVARVIEGTRFTLGDLFEQRVREVPDRMLLQHAGDAHVPGWSYQRAARQIRSVAAALLGPAPGADSPAGAADSPTAAGRPRVVIFAENAMATAAADLACLFHDIFVAPLSVHTDSDTLAWIVERLAVDTVVTDSEDRLLKALRVRDRTGRPTRILRRPTRSWRIPPGPFWRSKPRPPGSPSGRSTPGSAHDRGSGSAMSAPSCSPPAPPAGRRAWRSRSRTW